MLKYLEEIINYLNLGKVISKGDLVHSAAKLIIGLLIFVAGIYWYVAEVLGMPGVGAFLLGVGGSTFHAFLTVFAGLFGAFLIFLGLIIAWIEYEDLKWESKEKKEKQTRRPARPARRVRRRRR
jgi:hypothetical protein